MAEGPIAVNRKATFQYEILEKWEAGIVLTGTEAKSIRLGRVNLGDSYAIVRQGEIYLLHCHISPYQNRQYSEHDPLRTRKLLMHKAQIQRLLGLIQQKGHTLIPLRLYYKKGMVKIEIGLGKGKNLLDKRRTIRDRESARDLARVQKGRLSDKKGFTKK